MKMRWLRHLSRAEARSEIWRPYGTRSCLPRLPSAKALG